MVNETLNKDEWAFFCNFLSKESQGRQIMLELVGEEIGDQIEEDWSRFESLDFDLASNTLYVRTSVIEHPIYSPKSVTLFQDGLVKTIGITDAEGRLQLVHFRDPLLVEGGSNHGFQQDNRDHNKSR